MLRLSMEERKDYIAKYAAKVFSEKGYQLASLQDIAKKARISKAGVYHYFKTKDDILAYIVIKHSEDFLVNMTARIRESRQEDLPPWESFRKLIKTYAKLVNRDRDRRLIVLRERHQLTGKNKNELLKRERAIFHLIRDELKKLDGIEKKIDQNVITFLFIAMSHWLGYWFREGKGLGLDDIIEQNIGIILQGILKSPERIVREIGKYSSRLAGV